MTPDVNVLVAAFRPDHAHHRKARSWLAKARADCARGAKSLVLLPMVLAGFPRLVTNKRVFTNPDSIEDAVGFLDALLDSPGVEAALAGGEWPLFRTLLLTRELEGNLVTDAWIAASVQVLSENLVTFDRDFKKLLPSRDLTLLD